MGSDLVAYFNGTVVRLSEICRDDRLRQPNCLPLFERPTINDQNRYRKGMPERVVQRRIEWRRSLVKTRAWTTDDRA
jgi:hypothetical protein